MPRDKDSWIARLLGLRKPHKEPAPEATRRQSHDRNDPVTHDHDYTDDERDFMCAMDRYKRDNHRLYPAWNEVLAVLVSLGWRRTEKPGPPPKFVRGPPGPGGSFKEPEN